MRLINNEWATKRTVSYERDNFDTFEFDSFDEALNHLVIGDSVLAFHNCGRYLMKAYMMDKDCITCSDAVGITEFRRNSDWHHNGLVRVYEY